MPEMKFCYCCRAHHPIEQMRLFPTRQGHRWRCVRSIEAAVRSRHERDAFGEEQTRINHQAASRTADFARRLRQHTQASG